MGQLKARHCSVQLSCVNLAPSRFAAVHYGETEKAISLYSAGNRMPGRPAERTAPLTSGSTELHLVLDSEAKDTFWCDFGC